MDAIHYSVRQDGIVIKKAVYILIGINTRGGGSTCEGTTRGKLKKIRQYP